MSTSGVVPTPDALRKRWPLLLGVLISLFGLEILSLVLPEPAVFSGPRRWLRLIGPSWFVAGVVVAGVVWVERRSLDSIGLERPSVRDLGLGVAGFVVGVVSFALTQPLVQALGLTSTTTGVRTLATFPMWVVVAIALTAGITEEVLFRGYPIERMAEVTGNLWVGAAVTFVVFTVGHVSWWGVGGAIQIGVWTLVVTVLYVYTRNLPACILMHVSNDLFAFIVLPILIGA